ncbi:TPA: hypothetical protein ACH3X2_004797 [Trebouxia sp. C0005]
MRVYLVVNTANVVAFMSNRLDGNAGPNIFQLSGALSSISAYGAPCASFQDIGCILLQRFLQHWMQALSHLCTKLCATPSTYRSNTLHASCPHRSIILNAFPLYI